MRDSTPISWPQMREYVFTFFLAGLYVNLANNFLNNYRDTGRISSLIYILFELIVVIVVLSRRQPKTVSWNANDWMYALAGTALPMFFLPGFSQTNDLILLTMQCIGTAISLTGIVALNRSFGIVPANRGVKSSGLYRLVRHPIYLGYTITYAAIVFQNFTLSNVLIVLAFYFLQIMRIIAEERFLMQDPAYADYASRVRSRLIPGIW